LILGGLLPYVVDADAGKGASHRMLNFVFDVHHGVLKFTDLEATTGISWNQQGNTLPHDDKNSQLLHQQTNVVAKGGRNILIGSGTASSINNMLEGLVYIPNENWYGEETLSLHVSDGVVSTSETININVKPSNDLPLITMPSFPNNKYMVRDCLEDTPYLVGPIIISDVDLLLVKKDTDSNGFDVMKDDENHIYHVMLEVRKRFICAKYLYIISFIFNC
jgi:hypothetical protein